MDISRMHEEMLYPMVRVHAPGAAGSGTIIYTGRRADGRHHTLVLTNHHVVSSAIEIAERWDSTLRRTVKVDERQPVQVQEFAYERESVAVTDAGHLGHIVAWDHMDKLDLALLEVDVTEQPAAYVARLLPREEVANLRLFDPIYALGSPAGHTPYPTDGMLTSLREHILGQEFWMVSSPVWFGNSGGGIFRRGREGHWELIGLPSRVHVSGSMFAVDVVTHLSYILPITQVYEFLAQHCFQYVFDPTQTIEQCERRRERLREADQLIRLERERRGDED